MAATPTPVRPLARVASPAGLLGAGILFALSLFPSLLPRTSVTQGLISGVAVAIGYGLGTLVHWAWDYVGLPRTNGLARWIVTGTVWLVVTLLIVSATWQHVGWQNEVRGLMGIEPTTPLLWPPLVVVAGLVAGALLAIGRAVRLLFALSVRQLQRWLTNRQARMASVAILATLAWGLWSGVIVNGFFAGANEAFGPRDAVTFDGVSPPTSALRSGGPDSLVDWETLGRQGQRFVATGPTRAQLEVFHGSGAQEPIRVFAGLKSADTLQERANLVLAELQRTNAFDRDLLVIATTTGTGLLDPDGVDPLEWLYNGDTAIVGVQYSYLPSWISLLADQAEVQRASQVVFETIHGHWRSLPAGSRPEIYLYGLSLGSLGVESILTSVNLVNEPIDGALMVGPPFVNDLHDRLVATRDPGSPAWLPVVDEGRTVRFMAQDSDPTGAQRGSAEWGDTRLLYLQYPSDPVVNFSTDMAWSRPAWLSSRGPEVADSFVWVPLVSMWQVLIDLPAAGSVPEGYAHLYAPWDNARAWAAVTEPDGWTDRDMQRLEDLLLARGTSQ